MDSAWWFIQESIGMENEVRNILTINGGSSSVKFSLYNVNGNLKQQLKGSITRIGLQGAGLTVTRQNKECERQPAKAHNMQEAAGSLMDWLKKENHPGQLTAIGHRIVHGMNHTKAELVTPALLNELHQIGDYDPDHLPGEVELIKAFAGQYPQISQVACFDTVFHSTLPELARLLPIPGRFRRAGIRRYGFHGLSYSYLMEDLAAKNPGAAKGKIILAHLGNGASMAAVRDGMSMDTSMGFTPAGGFLMGTRPGDLDPGVAAYMINKESLTGRQFNELINHQSGLLGISETSPDMLDLLRKQDTDPRAAEAIGLFCYQAKKWIGSFTAVLGGLDTLVFSGGIGENAAPVRAGICEGLKFMGIELDPEQNKKNARVISAKGSQVTVYVIPTDEELMIAKTVCRVLSL